MTHARCQSVGARRQVLAIGVGVADDSGWIYSMPDGFIFCV